MSDDYWLHIFDVTDDDGDQMIIRRLVPGIGRDRLYVELMSQGPSPCVRLNRGEVEDLRNTLSQWLGSGSYDDAEERTEDPETAAAMATHVGMARVAALNAAVAYVGRWDSHHYTDVLDIGEKLTDWILHGQPVPTEDDRPGSCGCEQWLPETETETETERPSGPLADIMCHACPHHVNEHGQYGCTVGHLKASKGWKPCDCSVRREPAQ